MAQRHRQELAELIGLLTNTVLLRTHLVGNPSLREVLQQVRETTLAAAAHQDLPFEDLVQVLEHEPGVQRESLCRILFVLQNATRQPPAVSPLTFRLLVPDPQMAEPTMTPTTFDLIVLVYHRSEGLIGRCVYKTQLFRATTISRLLQDFCAVLAHAVMQPAQTLAVFDELVQRHREGGTPACSSHNSSRQSV
jgi:non-ribosomal peptide synthetase component F